MCDFALPIAALNLRFEYVEAAQASGMRERLVCPRCNRPVTNKHGTCDNCRENAYQCRQCRNINYEQLDAFLCNECGFCKHAKFAYSISQRASIAAPRVDSEDARVAALAVVERESATAQEQYSAVREQRGPLSRLVATLAERDDVEVRIGGGIDQVIASCPPLANIGRKVLALALTYGVECRATFEKLSSAGKCLFCMRLVSMFGYTCVCMCLCLCSQCVCYARRDANCYVTLRAAMAAARRASPSTLAMATSTTT